MALRCNLAVHPELRHAAGAAEVLNPAWKLGAVMVLLLRSLIVAIGIGAMVGNACAQSTRIAGTAGYLSEWKSSGKLKKTGPADGKQFSGALTWKYVGLCSVNGPEEKSGDITLQLSNTGPAAQIHAELWLDGARCSYSGTLSDGDGRMDCSDARAFR